MLYKYYLISAALICLTWIVGCGDGRPTRVPVQGVVQVNGQPLTGEYAGYVRLIPTGKGRPASGEINPATGMFTLGNYDEADGCPLGEFKVEVAAYQIKGMKLRYMIPPRFNSFQTSELSTVIEGENANLIIDVPLIPSDKKYETLWETIGG